MSDLDPGQRARVEALGSARSLLSSRGELDITDLHALASFILNGGDLYPSTTLEPALQTLAGDVIDPWGDRCPARHPVSGAYCSHDLGHNGWHESYLTRQKRDGERVDTWLSDAAAETDAHD